MGQVVVTVNGQAYKLACRDGEEAQIGALAGYVEDKVRGLIDNLGNVGDSRLLLMAALIIADELMETRQEADSGRDLADKLNAAAAEIEDIAVRVGNA